MLEFFTAWGAELIMGLVATAISSFFVYRNKELKKELDKAKQYDKDQEKEEIQVMIDNSVVGLKEEHQHMDADLDKKLEPLYIEMENLREFARQTNIDKDNMKQLLLDSWKFRLKTLCTMHIEHGEITMAQLTQLQEFFSCYEGLGGNGVVKQLYERAVALPIKLEEQQTK